MGALKSKEQGILDYAKKACEVMQKQKSEVAEIAGLLGDSREGLSSAAIQVSKQLRPSSGKA